MHKIIVLFAFLSQFGVSALELVGERTQGAMFVGKTEPGDKVYLDGKLLKVSSAGDFVFGFGRDAKLEHELTVKRSDGTVLKEELVLTKRQYQEQKIEGVASKYVSPPDDVLARIREDNRKIGKARSRDDDRIDFTQQFIWPAEGPVSGVYGSRRIFNGTPKRPHYGLDVAAPVGTPVYAPADGIVTLFEPDMYYSGGTMIIDHGHGISSTFLHLSASKIEVGTRVKQGQLVAEIGNTGRVTGAHLDWRLNWFKERLDPASVVPER